jgi:chromate transporter
LSSANPGTKLATDTPTANATMQRARRPIILGVPAAALVFQRIANFFALAQSIPGPNMILMMSFVGWKVWGFPGALASAFATFGPPCAIYFAGYRLWDRFRHAPWQRIVRLGLVPVTMGIVIASGAVMARAADTGWRTVALTIAAAAITLATRFNPMWTLLAGAALGGLGLL